MDGNVEEFGEFEGIRAVDGEPVDSNGTDENDEVRSIRDDEGTRRERGGIADKSPVDESGMRRARDSAR